MVTVASDIKYVGVDDSTLDLFENQYKILYGVTYNSYVILDEKVAVMDTVDKRMTVDWMSKVEEALEGRKPDYLVVQHLEPDHSGNIQAFLFKNPDTKIVCSEKAAAMIGQFVDEDLSDRIIAKKEGDTLELGKHTLKFYMAPMVHWPEVMVSYDEYAKVLFSADAFGTFGDSNNRVSWIVEARRYYFNIVGKYGNNVQALLKKLESLDVETIAPLHGPFLNEDIEEYINYYKKWSSYEPELNGVFIAYASAHGNTKEAAMHLKDILQEKGQRVITVDLSRDDMSRAIEGMFGFNRTVLAGITYDGELFPPMADLLSHLKNKNFQKRTIGIIENGSWAPIAGKKIREELEKMKDITILDPVVTIKTKRKPADEPQFEALANAIVEAGKGFVK